jgi:resuscitation-promoting factor RpfA
MAQRARGRHRKPNNPTRNLGIATAPIVAAIPLATSVAPAQAATTRTWDRLANCESGGNWHINTGNGYYGGLQFSDGTWDAYRNGKFAGRADRATRMEQITVAERLLDDRGWSPWPACSSRLGLDASDRRGSPDGNSDRQRNGDRKRDKARDRASENRDRDRADRGKHRKASGVAVYVVRRGDTLSAIANRKNVPGGWHKLYRINREKIGGNPNLIRIGQQLRLR